MTEEKRWRSEQIYDTSTGTISRIRDFQTYLFFYIIFKTSKNIYFV